MVLQMFVDMATNHAEPFLVCTAQLRQTAEQQPATLPLIAQIYGQMGRTSKVPARRLFVVFTRCCFVVASYIHMYHTVTHYYYAADAFALKVYHRYYQ